MIDSNDTKIKMVIAIANTIPHCPETKFEDIAFFNAGETKKYAKKIDPAFPRNDNL